MEDPSTGVALAPQRPPLLLAGQEGGVPSVKGPVSLGQAQRQSLSSICTGVYPFGFEKLSPRPAPQLLREIR